MPESRLPRCLRFESKSSACISKALFRWRYTKEQTGISWGAILKAIDLFESGGTKALKPKRCGCKKGALRIRIEVFYLPNYSPELNPDERLNADLKHAITTSVPRRTKDGLLKKTIEHMNKVKSSPERVKTYFKDKHVAYAAEST